MHPQLTYQTRIQDTGKALPPENLRKVFISYKKSDDISLGIRDSVADVILSCMNIAIWNDTNLTPGLDYDDEIKRAITESDAVVLLLTEHVLESEYVWEKEIAFAQRLEKGIIPIAVGISEQDLKIADQRLNHRHCLSCPISEAGQFDMDTAFKEKLQRALDVYVMDIDLVGKISQFFASDKHQVSVRYLSYEQIFYMGCGYLSGIGTSKNINLSIPLLKSILHGYGDDSDFVELKRIVSGKLFYHYAEHNAYANIREYALLALEYGNIAVLNELNEWYRNDTYPEMASDMELRVAFYRAVRKYGLRENYVLNENPKIRTTMLSVRKVETTEKKKSSIWVNGSEFCLKAQKIETLMYKTYLQIDYRIYLMRDDVAIDCFEPTRSPGPGNGLFLSYDPEKQTIQVLETDFDHYEVDTGYFEYTYHHIFEDKIERHFSYVGNHKYASLLPYSTRRW